MTTTLTLTYIWTSLERLTLGICHGSRCVRGHYSGESLILAENADHPMIYETLHPDYCLELQVILSQYYEEVFGCKAASQVATPLPHRRSNYIGASSLLRLHRTVAMAAVMVTSVPCESHPLCNSK